ncbi:MAG: hypothetical protein ACLFN1_00590 [Bacteroidales bacterium]
MKDKAIITGKTRQGSKRSRNVSPVSRIFMAASDKAKTSKE